MADKIKQRRDTRDNWEAVNPILDEGELGIILDSNAIVIGDGVTEFVDLQQGPVANDGNILSQNNIVTQQAPSQHALLGYNLEDLGTIVPAGISGSWDEKLVESPMVFFDENKQLYGMVYVGYNNSNIGKIGLAWSTDLIHWEKDPLNPIFSPSEIIGSSDYASVTGPFIWYEKGLYYLFYIGCTEVGYESGIKTLNLATSSDLYNWTRYENNPIISPDSNAPWRDTAIWHPNIVKKDNVYYLFFNATGHAEGYPTEEYIGYATSTDLFHWTVDDLNSPILPLPEVGTFGYERQGDPFVYKIGNTWYMAYYSKDENHTWSDGIAYTSDSEFPLGWKHFSKNPVLYDDFAKIFKHKPAIFLSPNAYYHYYTKVEGSYRNIGLAVEGYPVKNYVFNINPNGIDYYNVTSTTPADIPNCSIITSQYEGHPLKVRIIVNAKVDPGTTLNLRIEPHPATYTNFLTFTETSDTIKISPWSYGSPSLIPKISKIQASVDSGTAYIKNIQIQIRTIETE